MNKAALRGRAKINLTLDILGKRPDGYHEVAMIMQAIELSDIIEAQETSVGTGIRIVCELPGPNDPRRNLAYRAAALFLETYGIRQGVRIAIEKRIPVSAGLAGGSTDAGATILALDRLFGIGAPPDELYALGAKIGSDVPFCMQGGTMLATGRGEKLRRLPELAPCHVVLCKLPVSVSTAWAYQNYKPLDPSARPDTDAAVACLEKRDLTGICKLLCNVLESVTIGRYPKIAAVKRSIEGLGAAALMSGSGPTVFALTEDAEKAAYIASELRASFDAAVLLTKSVCGD